MSEVKKIATREGYGDGLAELGAVNPNVVVLDADLAAATKTGVFKKAFPERFFDCGIAEGNMMGIAAGLATTGKIPFASTFAISPIIGISEIFVAKLEFTFNINIKVKNVHATVVTAYFTYINTDFSFFFLSKIALLTT